MAPKATAKSRKQSKPKADTNRKKGRPTKYTKSLANKLCHRIAQGKSLRSICDKSTVFPTIATVYNWINSDPDFLAQYERAKEDSSDAMADDIMHIADTEPDPHRAKVRIDARKWIASKLKPKKYGERLDVKHSGGLTLEGKLRAIRDRQQPVIEHQGGDQALLEGSKGANQ